MITEAIGILIICGLALAVLGLRKENRRLRKEHDFQTKFFKSILARRDEERQVFYLGKNKCQECKGYGGFLHRVVDGEIVETKRNCARCAGCGVEPK